MGVTAEKPVTLAEVEERMAIAKTYGPHAVANLAAEFRRRSTPVELEAVNGFGFVDLSKCGLEKSTSSSPITGEILASEQANDEATSTINKPKFTIGDVSIPAGSTKDFTIDVSPLSLSQDIKIAPVAPLSETWDGIVWKTWVSGVNELTVRLANVTDKAIKLAKQEFFQVSGVGSQPLPNASAKANSSTDLQKCGLEAAGPDSWISAESYLQKRRSHPKQKELDKLKQRMDAHDGPPTKEENAEYLRLKYGSVDNADADTVTKRYTPTQAQILQHDDLTSNAVGF
jgi:hypothetical protein